MNSRLRPFTASFFTLSGFFCLSTAFLPVIIHAQPVRGVYVSGAGGVSFNQDQVVRRNAIMPDGRDKYSKGATAVGSVGYGLGNGFRIEVEGNYRNNPLKYQNLGAYKARGEGRQQTYGFMVNALFDLDVGSPYIFPYFGAGIGYGWSSMNGVRLRTADHRLTEHIGGTFGQFSYQGIGGLSFPTPWVVGLSFTTEYRFWTMLAPQSHTADVWGTQGGGNSTHPFGHGRGNRDTTTYFNHSILLGLRYEFNPAPPPSSVPVEEPVVVPKARNSRLYLVFFNWDSYSLNTRARAIVHEAAQAYNSVQNTRIEANGYTDTSATPNEQGKRYNIELSLKRAKEIQSELIRNGVPANNIDIHGYGSERLRVQTGPNVREARNRRVEIILR